MKRRIVLILVSVLCLSNQAFACDAHAGSGDSKQESAAESKK